MKYFITYTTKNRPNLIHYLETHQNMLNNEWTGTMNPEAKNCFNLFNVLWICKASKQIKENLKNNSIDYNSFKINIFE